MPDIDDEACPIHCSGGITRCRRSPVATSLSPGSGPYSVSQSLCADHVRGWPRVTAPETSRIPLSFRVWGSRGPSLQTAQREVINGDVLRFGRGTRAHQGEERLTLGRHRGVSHRCAPRLWFGLAISPKPISDR